MADTPPNVVTLSTMSMQCAYEGIAAFDRFGPEKFPALNYQEFANFATQFLYVFLSSHDADTRIIMQEAMSMYLVDRTVRGLK